MKKLILIIAVVFSGMLGQAQNTLSFTSYKSINKDYSGDSFSNEYDSEYKIVFYPDKIVSIDLRMKSEILPESTYTSIHYIDNVAIQTSGSLYLEIKNTNPNTPIHYILIDDNRIQDRYYKYGKLSHTHTSFIKSNIESGLIKYYKNR